MKRRQFLGASAATVALGSLAGCGWFRGEPPSTPAAGVPAPMRIFRRKNLVHDFSAAEQRELSDLIYSYLTPEIVAGHMMQVDHMDNLFTDHRGYLFEIERLLIRDGHLKFVPLPFWDPIDDVPDGWMRVQERYRYMPLAPYNMVPRAVRPRPKPSSRPENVAAHPTAQAVAIDVGRTATSALGSFHFNSHASLGGPFVTMGTAAAALMFWAFHGLLVDLYEKWFSARLAEASKRVVVGRRGDGGFELFTVTSANQLWHARERLKTMHRSEVDEPLGEVDVTFPHWSHWQQIEGRDVDDARVAADRDGRLALVVRARSASGAFNDLVLLRQAADGWTSGASLNAGAAELRDFAVAADTSGRLQIVAIRVAGGGAAMVSATTETAAGSGRFGAWTDIAPAGPWRGLAVAGPHVVMRSDAGVAQASRSGGGWTVRDIATAPFTDVQIAGADAAIFGIRQADSLLCRFDGGTWTPIGANPAPVRDFSLAPHAGGRLEAFATDQGGVLRRCTSGPGSAWSAWTEMPLLGLLAAARAPIAARASTGRIRVFVQGQDHFTYVAEQTAPDAPTWLGWTTV